MMATSMHACYFDTSALIKRYIDESGSTWLREIISTAGEYRYIAEITGVEVVSAIARLAAGRHISERVRTTTLSHFKQDFLQGYVVISVNTALIQSAMRLAEQHVIRGYDAVQLASALWIKDRLSVSAIPLIFVSADVMLNKAARAEGLRIENPHDHA